MTTDHNDADDLTGILGDTESELSTLPLDADTLVSTIEDAHPLFKDVEQTVLPTAQELPSEPQEGNIEYKLKLIDPTPERLVHLTTQMHWRLAEGGGEAIYQIGVGDDGALHGLSLEELQTSLRTLAIMAERVGATFTLLRTSPALDDVSHIAEVHVRKAEEGRHFVDVRVLVVGPSGSGKSTLIGCLATGRKDTGQGLTRLDVFRHHHEVATGRTSSLSTAVVGFDSAGTVLNYDSDLHEVPLNDICAKATKLVHITDSPGFEKYEKTTLFGLTSRHPDHVFVVINGSTGLTESAARHLSLALVLRIPMFLAITKIDKCDKQRLKKTLVEVISRVKAAPHDMVPQIIRSADGIHTLFFGGKLQKNVVPIFLVSSMTRKNFPLILNYLNLLPPVNEDRLEARSRQKPVILVEETFRIEDATIVGGKVSKGLVRVGDMLQIGPLADGTFTQCTIKSIQRNRAYVAAAKAGQMASFAVDVDDVRRGQVLCAPEAKVRAWTTFKADVLLMDGADMLREGCQCTVFVRTVRQTATVVRVEGFDGDGDSDMGEGDEDFAEFYGTGSVDDDRVDDDDDDDDGGRSEAQSPLQLEISREASASAEAPETRATHRIILKFLQQPELIDVGMRVVLHASPMRAIGHIVDLQD